MIPSLVFMAVEVVIAHSMIWMRTTRLQLKRSSIFSIRHSSRRRRRSKKNINSFIFLNILLIPIPKSRLLKILRVYRGQPLTWTRWACSAPRSALFPWWSYAFLSASYSLAYKMDDSTPDLDDINSLNVNMNPHQLATCICMCTDYIDLNLNNGTWLFLLMIIVEDPEALKAILQVYVDHLHLLLAILKKEQVSLFSLFWMG